MTPEALAALHVLVFHAVLRPWTVAEFVTLLAQETTILATRRAGFALGRVAGPEAELLTLAVHPEARRQGVGRALVQAFEAEATARGAEKALIEVSVENAAACALYRGLGYRTVGRRPAYYGGTTAPPVDALVLGKPLGASLKGH